MAMGIEHLRVILQEPGKLFPFLVCSASANPLGQRFKSPQDFNFRLKFSDGSSRCRLINDRLFGLFDLRIRGVIKFIDILISEVRYLLSADVLKLSAALEYLLLAQASLKSFSASPQ